MSNRLLSAANSIAPEAENNLDIFFKPEMISPFDIKELVKINDQQFARVDWEFLERKYPDKVVFFLNPIVPTEGEFSVVAISICSDKESDAVMKQLLDNNYPVTFGKTASTFVGGM